MEAKFNDQLKEDTDLLKLRKESGKDKNLNLILITEAIRIC